MNGEVVEKLRGHGILPSAQRVAVAEYVLATNEHPSAERVFSRVKRRFPMVSRATVYNTLNLFVEKGLLQQLVLAAGNVVFDPWVENHHHFVDEATGKVHDIPWKAIEVKGVGRLKGFDVRKFHVVLKGRRRE
jgi:Fe2+ or Zn2+ uptake regulation protein